MGADYSDEVKNIVLKRLQAIPPNVTFSIGEHGTFSRDQLMHEVEKGTSVGKAAIDMQLNFIRKMTTIAA
ncbi:hypothetical protein HYU12_02685 [Candidatus Woesearchaeota archaeon]|nr:hypothetical protein [Candidatus Woesearchaeota archaeon]